MPSHALARSSISVKETCIQDLQLGRSVELTDLQKLSEVSS